MKKNYLYLATTALVMASCASDDLSGDAQLAQGTGDGTINFNLKTGAVTRATLSGESAADKLNKEFVVYATKHAKAEDGTAGNDAIAFQNYKVTYTAGTAGTTSSNTANWEYVGVTPYTSAQVSPSSVTTQTIKYWDYNAAEGYTFTAFSGAKLFADGATGKVEKTTADPATDNKSVYAKGYKVTIPASASLDDIYFSDRKTVAKADYNKPVTLTFRNFGAKVRVGFYETVPGYSVKIDKFYSDSRTKAEQISPVTKYADMKTANESKFVAALQNVNAAATDGNVVTVTYGNGTDGVAENQVKVNAGSTSTYQYTLTLGEKIQSATSLGTDASKVTWDLTDGAYTTVYPNLDNTTPMLIRCDYTLTADDGSGETIKVKNARVIVPAQYCQWKSNYAYTYLFKITENTNGTSGTTPTDPDKPDTGDKEGLFPITFDAVTITATEDQQETATTISSNSVTTYSKTSNVTKNNEYKANEDIYFVNQSTSLNSSTPAGHDILAVSEVKKETAGAAYVYSIGQTAFTEAQIIAKLTGTNVSGLTLAEVSTGVEVVANGNVPSASGPDLAFGTKGALKFTPTTAGYYAYVYCNTAYKAPTYTAVTGEFDANTTYYYKNDDNFYYVASGINADNFATYKDSLYTVDTTNAKAGSYDVKVVKVVAQ